MFIFKKNSMTKAKKNILLIVQNNSFPFDKRVKKEAVSLINNGLNVYVLSPTSEIESEKVDNYNGINIKRYVDHKSDGSIIGYLKEYSLSLAKIYFYSLKLVLKNKIKVVHFANPPDFFWPLFIILKIFSVKIIYDQHDLSPELSDIKFRNNFIFKLLKFNERMSLKYADGIIFANNTFLERALKTNKIDHKLKEIVFNGPEKKFSTIFNEELKKLFNNKKIALFVGLMSVEDNLEVIVQVADEIVNNRKYGDIVFILVGDGDSRKKIEQYIDELNLKEYFYFTGLVSHEKVQEYLGIADVCLTPDLPNGLNEYLTLIKVLEYMKAKKTFVAFDLYETKNLAGESGLYSKNIFDFADNVINLLNNKEAAIEKGEIGYEIIQNKYCWDLQEKKLLNLYNKIMIS
ncbi:MAG: hypothetical protein CR986_06895 [Ignavibacteriae bacterium]|nr:MAG: hypothetical protein CR986_06895 [Ignavibacteriota bacterium]